MSLLGENLLCLEDVDSAEVERLLNLAADLKENGASHLLEGKSAALVFLNPSLRTRTSFELAMHRLGGHAVVLSPGADAWKLEARDGVTMDGEAAEHVKEAAGVISRMVDILGVRAFPSLSSYEEDAREAVLSAFARHSSVPVVNMESSLSHPLQALADLMTLREQLGVLNGKRLLLTWAYHPRPLPIAVPRSVLLAACRAGMHVTLSHPQGFDLPEETMRAAAGHAGEAGGSLSVVSDPDAGFRGVDAVYAKSWAAPSFYGRFAEEAPLREAARGWKVTSERMALAASGASFLHCLPVRRNVVVDDAVLDGPSSKVLVQAENRLWTTMAAVLSILE